jgi:FtsH-binding integral membrane protein
MWKRHDLTAINADADSVIKTGFRLHIAEVNANFAAGFALAALFALAASLVPQSIQQSRTLWVGTPLLAILIIAFYRKRREAALFASRASNTVRGLFFASVGLIAAAAEFAFISEPRGTVARVCITVAGAFAMASLWGYRMRRDFSANVENIIVGQLFLFTGFFLAQIVEIVAWRDGIEYFKYTIGLRSDIPPLADPAGSEFAISFIVVIYFCLTLVYYARRIRGRDFSRASAPDKRFEAISAAFDLYLQIFYIPIVLVRLGRMFT